MEQIEEWPQSYLDELKAAPPGGYGWQRWRARPRDLHEPEWSVGVYHPTVDIGLRAYRWAGQTRRYAWRRGESLEAGRTGWATYQSEPPPTEGAKIFGLVPFRSLRSVEERIDLETPIVDHARPDESRPVGARLQPPPGSGVARRYEGLPEALPYRGDLWILRSASGPWLLDVWLAPGSDDDVERLRFQVEHPWDTYTSRTLDEYRFLPIDAVLTDDGLVSPDPPEQLTASNEEWRGYETWTPTRAMPLQVTLDPAGRPYEVQTTSTDPATRRSVGTIAAPGGALLVMDGNAVQVNPAFFADVSTAVRVMPDRIDGEIHEINVDLIEEDDHRSTVGVWLGPHDATVDTWDSFEYAYGTDGGVGGVIDASIIEAAAALARDQQWIEEPDYGARFSFHDLDDRGRPRTFVFSNGWGDGGFPLSRGRSSNGEIVVVVILRTDFPWRLAVPEGRPPPTVTDRETNLIECMSGLRPVRPDGSCDFDTDTW